MVVVSFINVLFGGSAHSLMYMLSVQCARVLQVVHLILTPVFGI